jgi:hypothetical protein
MFLKFFDQRGQSPCLAVVLFFCNGLYLHFSPAPKKTSHKKYKKYKNNIKSRKYK